VVDQFGGRTFGVYEPNSRRDLAQAQQMLDQGRVQHIGPADYRHGSETCAWLLETVAEIAERLACTPPVAQTAAIAPTPAHIYK
jgi:hypothetical protein